MKLPQIITSLLETDLYKISMGNVILKNHASDIVTWDLKIRNKDVHFTEEMVKEITDQIAAFCELRFTKEELNYLKGIKWIRESYIDFLKLWHPWFEDFTIKPAGEHGLEITTNGTWVNTSMYEIPVFAIVNEVYFRMNYDYNMLSDSFEERLEEKYNKVRNNDWYLGVFSEFGLRRRLSKADQAKAVQKFSHLNDTQHCATKFIGTSNILLAKECGVTPVGTMAHEWIMCVGQGNQKHNPAFSNFYALKEWVDEYGVFNGIALTDTITTDCFLRDFDIKFATLFNGVRHDSGDPYIWGDKMIAHYEKLGIDPKTKTLLFSDSLNFEKADKIWTYFHTKAKVAFGIGTYIANDTCVPPLNIVMKTVKCNGYDVAKISDTEGKGMCRNPQYVDYLQRSINWRMEQGF